MKRKDTKVKNYKRKLILLCLSMGIAASHAAYAEESDVSYGRHQTSLEQARTEEEWARLRDNTVEWDEIEDLVHEYNPTVSDMWISFRQDEKDGKYNSDYEDVISMIEDNYEAALQGAATDVLEALTELQYRTGFEESSVDKQAQSTDRESALLNIEKTEKAVTASIKESIIDLYRTELQYEMDLETAGYKEALYKSAVTKQASGLMTETNVLSAKEAMEKSKLTVSQDENSLKKKRQLLNVNLGFGRNDSVIYPEVPLISEETFSLIDVNQDQDNGVKANYSININERKLQVSNAESSINSLSVALETQKENVRTDILSRYNTLKQSKSSYEESVTGAVNAANALSAAQRSYSLGSISQRDLEKADYQAKTTLISSKIAMYKYTSAFYSYRSSVLGLASAD